MKSHSTLLRLPLMLFLVGALNAAESERAVAAMRQNSYGFFLGADGTHLPNKLSFAAHDAVSLAMRMSIELGMIEASNVVIAVDCNTSSSTSPATDADLEALRARGARVFANISENEAAEAWRYFQERLNDRPGTNFVLAFVSGHGTQRQADHQVLLPISAAKTDPHPFTINQLTRDLNDMNKRWPKVLLVDTCRVPPVDVKSASSATTYSGADAHFFDELFDARGIAIATSCSANQSSYEDPALSHGLFTYFLLDEICKRRSSDEKVTFGRVLGGVTLSVRERAGKAGKEQIVHLTSDGDLQALPFGVPVNSPEFLAFRMQRVAKAKARLDRIFPENEENNSLRKRIIGALGKDDQVAFELFERPLDDSQARELIENHVNHNPPVFSKSPLLVYTNNVTVVTEEGFNSLPEDFFERGWGLKSLGKKEYFQVAPANLKTQKSGWMEAFLPRNIRQISPIWDHEGGRIYESKVFPLAVLPMEKNARFVIFIREEPGRRNIPGRLEWAVQQSDQTMGMYWSEPVATAKSKIERTVINRLNELKGE